jgi:hypothetical protein
VSERGSPSSDDDRISRFLEDARAAGVFDEATYLRARAFLATRTSPVLTGAPPATGTPIGSLASVPLRPDRVPAGRPAGARPDGVLRAKPGPVIREPSSVRVWFERVKDSVAADLAVHGLAYLGVGLVFAGTLGFLFFSFGSVSADVRPYAELAIPTVLLGSAWFLRHRGAPVVANALGVIGGLLLPTVLFASYVDSAPVPPDISGTALGLSMVATSLLLAVCYGAYGLRHRDVSLRFLVAPMVWLAAWSAGLLLPGATDALDEWTALQFALVAVAVAGTAALVRAHPAAPLSVDAAPSIVPGAAIAVMMTLLLSSGEGWSWAPLVIAGLATMVTLELWSDRLDVAVAQVAQPAMLWVALAGVRQAWGDDIGAPVAMASVLALLEWQQRRRPGDLPFGAAAIGVVVALGWALLAGPWSVFASAIILSGWAHVRRIVPRPGEPQLARDATSAVAAIAPILAAGALVAAAPDGTAFPALGVVVLGASLATRLWRRDDAELAWGVLIAGAGLAVVAAFWEPLAPAEAAITVALATAALIITPGSTAVRVWGGVAGAAATALFVLQASGRTTEDAVPVVVAGAAVVAAILTWRADRVSAHAAAAAWVTASLGVMASQPGWGLVAGLSAWTAATASISAASEVRGRGAGALLDRIAVAGGSSERPSRAIAPALLLAGLAGLVIASGDAAGTLADDPEIVAVWLAALALVEAACTWLVRRRRPLALVVGWGAVILSLAAVAGSAGDVRATLTAVGLAIATSAVAVPRNDVFRWIAWIGSFVFVALAGEMADRSIWDRSLAVAVWGGAIGIGALLADDLRSGRRAVGRFVRSASFAPPAALGAVVFPLGLLAGMQGTDERIVVVAIVGAIGCAVFALLLRVGGISLLAYVFASIAAAVLSPRTIVDEPWTAVIWAAVLAAVGVALRREARDVPLVLRWDVPPLVLAAVFTTLAVSAAPASDRVAPTAILAGVLVLSVAWPLRLPQLAWIGGSLVIVGAVDAGSEAGALTLGAAAIGVAVYAVRVEMQRDARLVSQVLAGVLAAGSLFEVSEAIGWSTTTLATIAIVAAALVVAAATYLWARGRSVVATQLALVGAAFQLLGTGMALAILPDAGPLVLALLATAVETAALGTVTGRAAITIAAPPFACAAWVVATAEIVEGSSMWWAAPIGVAILVVVEIARADRRRRERPQVGRELLALEYAGMAAIVVPPVVEVMTDSPIDGLVGIAFGVGLAVWGILTKVRRRLFVGVAGVAALLCALIAGPVIELVPPIEGATLWVILALVGVLLIGAAAGVERGRARVQATVKRLGELLEAWE